MDKLDLLLDAIEHPENYTRQELENLMSDSETREVMQLLDKTRSAVQIKPQPDVADEWRQFSKTHHIIHGNAKSKNPNPAKRNPVGFFSNKAAGIIFISVSLACTAAGIGVAVKSASNSQKAELSQHRAISQNHEIKNHYDSVNHPVTPALETEIIIYENEPLEKILDDLAGYYSINLTYQSELPKSLRLYFKWNKENSIEEIVNMLNTFDHIDMSLQNNNLTIK